MHRRHVDIALGQDVVHGCTCCSCSHCMLALGCHLQCQHLPCRSATCIISSSSCSKDNRISSTSYNVAAVAGPGGRSSNHTQKDWCMTTANWCRLAQARPSQSRRLQGGPATHYIQAVDSKEVLETRNMKESRLEQLGQTSAVSF